MSYTYFFGAEFTKNKVKVTPANAPTIDIANADTPAGALVVSAGSPTQLTNMTGVYVYSYVASTIQNYIGLIRTADATVDLQDVPSFTGQPILNAGALDNIPITAPTGRAGTFREMIVQTWRRWFRAASLTPTTLTTYADDSVTPITTQTVTNSSTNETVGSA